MKRKHISSRVRQKIWEKYGGKCAYCGEPIPFKGMHVDHLIPLARGGADSDDNYMPACRNATTISIPSHSMIFGNKSVY